MGEGVYEGDFYSCRYFTAEGFLPGYNFPRLPISAYVPEHRRKGRDEFASGRASWRFPSAYRYA
jgi:hypothetical protein